MPPRDRLRPRSAGAAAIAALIVAAPIAALVVAASGFSLGSAAIPDPGLRAEVQVNLCDPLEQIVRALSLTPDPARALEIWYFESPGLEQSALGVVFRLRLGGGARILTLKAPATPDCAGLDPSLLPAGQGKCESDVHGESIRDTVSLDTALGEKTVRGLLDGSGEITSVLSPAQTRYLRTIAGAWPPASDLHLMGPTRVETLLPKGGLFVVEAWRLPGGQRFTEASQKTARADAPRLARRTSRGAHERRRPPVPRPILAVGRQAATSWPPREEPIERRRLVPARVRRRDGGDTEAARAPPGRRRWTGSRTRSRAASASSPRT